MRCLDGLFVRIIVDLKRDTVGDVLIQIEEKCGVRVCPPREPATLLQATTRHEREKESSRESGDVNQLPLQIIRNERKVHHWLRNARAPHANVGTDVHAERRCHSASRS